MAAKTDSKGAGAWLLFRCTMTSLVLSGFASSWLSAHYGWQALELIAPVSFFVAAMGNGWQPVFGALSTTITGLASRLGDKGGETK